MSHKSGPQPRTNPRRISNEKGESKPNPEDECKVATQTYLLLKDLIETPSKTTDELNKCKKLPEILQALNKDLGQLKSNVVDLVEHLGDLLSDKNRLPKDHANPTGNSPSGAAKGISETSDNTATCLLVRLRQTVDDIVKQVDRQQDEAVKSSLIKLDTKGLVPKCGMCESLRKKIVQIGKDVREQKCYFQEQKQMILTQLQTGNSELKDKVKVFKEKFTMLTKNLETMERKNQQMLSEKKQIESENKRLQHELKDISRKPQESARVTLDQIEETKRLKKQLKLTEIRLAEEMSSKIAADESSLENISIKTRPMNIASDYEQFCSHSWLTIKTFLDGKITEKEDEKVKFLTEVLMISESQAGHHFTEVKKWLLAMTQEPLQVKYDASTVKADKLLEGKDHSKEDVYITDKFRICADGVNLAVLEQSVMADVTKKLKSKYSTCTKEFKGKKANAYVSDCARLTWKMVIQRPPMRFETDTKIDWRGNDKVVEPAWGSDADSEKAVIRFYRHPTLYHGKAVMVKGKVIINIIK